MFTEAFNQTLDQFRISGTNLARISGVREATISDFRKGKIDPKASTLEALIEALPSEAKKFMLCKCISATLTDADIALELNLIANRIKASLEQSDSEIKFLKSIANQSIKLDSNTNLSN